MDNVFSPAYNLLVKLTFKDETHEFLVFSGALILASPVWRRTLDPNNGFAPLDEVERTDGGKSTRIPVITVEDVSPAAIVTFLNVLHHRSDKVSKIISFAELRDIAILIDQYRCAEAFTVFAELWIKALGSDGNHDPTAPEHVDWLLIGSLFPNIDECKDLFSETLLTLITMSQINTGDEDKWSLCKNDKFVEFDPTYIPQKVLDYALRHRLKLTNLMVSPFHAFAQDLLSHDVLANFGATKFCSSWQCFSIGVGTFLAKAHQEECQFILDAEPTVSEKFSVLTLRSSLMDLSVLSICCQDGPSFSHGSAHVGRKNVAVMWDNSLGLNSQYSYCPGAAKILSLMKEEVSKAYEEHLKEAEKGILALL